MLMLLIVFVLGALTILVVEALGIFILIRWLKRRVGHGGVHKTKPSKGSLSLSGEFGSSLCNKQGKVWVLESERIPQASNVQQKGKKEIVEVTPIQKFAKIKDHSLILTESDGSHVEILLKGCYVAAVSASSLSSRKWAKRFPVKVESRASALYKGSRIFYIYLETSWEKESWCKALRLATCEDEEKIMWFAKLNMEFLDYLRSLNAGYPSFLKPSSSFSADLVDKSSKLDGSSSKVRQFLKRLAKKSSKNASENKGSCNSISGYEERKISSGNSHSFQDLNLASGVMKQTRKPPHFSNEDVIVPSSIISSIGSGSQGQMSVISDADSDDRVSGDEGTLCLNLFVSRLFFDAKSTEQMKSSLQARIQRTLSNMRSPSYIGEVTCTDVNVGNLPPYIHAMRVLSSEMNEVWAFEIDVQYSGGAILDVETRLEVQDLDIREGAEASVVDDVKSDLLEGFEHIGKQFKHSEENVDEMNQRNEGDPIGGDCSNGVRSCNRMPSVSRWKSFLHSVAKQVSQVPLSLGITVASLRGTMRVYIKPPPSDQLWFGFTQMPDIDFNFDSSVGDRKISSGHLSVFLISRFKAAIRETLVLPNCESVCIPWMMAEKEDWVPRKVAPFMWINQEAAGNVSGHEAPSSHYQDATQAESDRGSTSGNAESKHEKQERVGLTFKQSKSLDPHALVSVPVSQPSLNSTPESKYEDPRQLKCKSLDPHASLLGPSEQPSVNSGPFEELRAPLLKLKEQQESPSRSTVENLEQNNSSEEDVTKPKRIGTRARMLGLGKKMGEKLEEKKRHMEEKRRNLMERMKSNKETS